MRSTGSRTAPPPTRHRAAALPRGRRRRRAPQGIQHLPPADQWQRAAAAGHVIAPAQDPRQQLPVAARPAMLARGSYVVSRRKLLNDLDVGNKTGARKYPFEQIVAE